MAARIPLPGAEGLRPSRAPAVKTASPVGRLWEAGSSGGDWSRRVSARQGDGDRRALRPPHEDMQQGPLCAAPEATPQTPGLPTPPSAAFQPPNWEKSMLVFNPPSLRCIFIET